MNVPGTNKNSHNTCFGNKGKQSGLGVSWRLQMSRRLLAGPACTDQTIQRIKLFLRRKSSPVTAALVKDLHPINLCQSLFFQLEDKPYRWYLVSMSDGCISKEPGKNGTKGLARSASAREPLIGVHAISRCAIACMALPPVSRDLSQQHVFGTCFT